MKWIVIAFAASALVTGLKAAYHWYESSMVQIDPGWTFENPEPFVPELKQMQWNGAIIDAASRSASLNKVAAQWSAASVFLGAISGIIGSLPA
jgi:hypothetical protein